MSANRSFVFTLHFAMLSLFVTTAKVRQLFYISIDDVDFCIRKQDAKKITVEKL